MEKESYDWLGIRYLLQKKVYLAKHCEFIETNNNESIVSLVYCKIMHSHNFCYVSSGKSVAFDEANEMYNMYIKKAPANTYPDATCRHLGHIMAATNCASELYSIPKVSKDSRYSLTTRRIFLKSKKYLLDPVYLQITIQLKKNSIDGNRNRYLDYL